MHLLLYFFVFTDKVALIERLDELYFVEALVMALVWQWIVVLKSSFSLFVRNIPSNGL